MDRFGVTSNGFSRKGYLDILGSMETRARELFGEDINLSERSPLGMFLQTISWEISNVWAEMENSHYNSSTLNANGNPLDDAVSNFGRYRFQGVKSRGKIKIFGNNGTIIQKGFLLATKDKLMYEIIDTVTILESEVIAYIQAVEIGVKYNVPANTISEIINPIAGVRSVTNIEPTTGGADIERDDSLRIRHLEALRKPTTGDNVSQYEVWAREVNGVGNIKVLPITPMKGYVTIVITDVNNQQANNKLLEDVYNHIDKLRPVNAGIYVKSAIAKEISISARVKLAEGYTIQKVKSELDESIKSYFGIIALKETYVSYAQIGRILLETIGIIDYDNLTVGGNVANIALENIEIPTLGDILLEVI
ncbi:baseplate J/gp47 family protein [Tissierella carlieri]|uniref:baseplate J/gp47 family protein n=1 Tax=Tissierella carlieri TaxID=689904 RepID=UPI001C0F7E56|nr:baseplate J/gp47 family protein [Tissierella carlieri]MBU5311467.1 baseplate J/gp47 family protein [Tissierella carlieri]